MCGATPVFADISQDSFNVDPDSVLDKLTNKTKAVIVVHLAGIPADLDNLAWILYDKGVKLIEDSCQALGAELHDTKVGTIGDVGVYSFYPSKIITTGEGGMIVTQDDEVAEQCRLIRHHGIPGDFRYYSKRLGYNYRMTEIQGALGCVELKDLDRRIKQYTKSYNELKNGERGRFFRFPKIPHGAKIAPTWAPAWTTMEILSPGFYIPLYRLPPLKQDINLVWTEFAAKRSVRLMI
jgi:perosamine synthetase